MATGGFPGSVLLRQLFRQLTKPISKSILNYARQRPLFRKYFLAVPGKMYYRLEYNLNLLRKVDPKQKDAKLKKIKEEEYIELGSQLMIEIIIFSLLVSIVILDWLRSSYKEEVRNRNEFKDFEFRKNEIKTKLEIQAATIKKLYDDYEKNKNMLDAILEAEEDDTAEKSEETTIE